MDKPYFAMLNTQQGGITPLMDDDDLLATYDYDYECEAAAASTILGNYYGFEVFEIGCGVISK